MAHLHQVPLVRLLDYFYYKEHLLIVTELLRDSIFNFYRYLRDASPEGHGAYFTLDTLRTLAAQLLSALAFMHQQVCTAAHTYRGTGSWHPHDRGLELLTHPNQQSP